VSTVDVYGPPQFLPLNEEHPTRPASFYGASKLAAEMLLRVFGERAAVPVTVLRLAQVYGPGDTSRKAIPNFIRSALRGDAIVIQGDGSDERDYVFVDDVVIAIELALTRHASGTFNIAGGHACSIRDVVTAIARLTGNTKTLVWERRATPATRQALDISAAEQHLDYRPRVNLEEGLRHTVAWFRQNACV
jgi:UDP-glucose 4-epimerase